ncbi:MAG: hypothetical protein RLZZ76_669, partial [Candidatus Parcubacteria bacterium]
LAGVVGAWIYFFTNKTPWVLFTVTLVAYFALTSTIAGFGTNPRYRLPVDPIIISLAAIGITYGIAWFAQSKIAGTIKKILPI